MPRRKKRVLSAHIGTRQLAPEILKYYEDRKIVVKDGFVKISGGNPRMHVVKEGQIGYPDIWRFDIIKFTWHLYKKDSPRIKPPISNDSPPEIKLRFLKNSGYYYLEFHHDDLFDGIWRGTNDPSGIWIKIDDAIQNLKLLKDCYIEIDVLKKRRRESYFLSGKYETELYYRLKEIINPILDKEKQQGNYPITILETIEKITKEYKL